MEIKRIVDLSITECIEYLALDRVKVKSFIDAGFVKADLRQFLIGEDSSIGELSLSIVDRLLNLIVTDKKYYLECKNEDDYNKYLAEQLDGFWRIEAQEYLDFNSCGSIKEYEKYIEKYTSAEVSKCYMAKYVDKAKDVIEDMLWNIQKKNTTGCKTYLKQYGHGRHVTEAQMKIKNAKKRNVIIAICALSVAIIAFAIYHVYPYSVEQDYSEGLAVVKKFGKYGYIDTKGDLVIPMMYEEAESFSEGLAAVKKDGHYGFIDKKGKTIIPFEYTMAFQFSEGLAAVRQQYYGYINRHGNVIVPFEYVFPDEFKKEGLARVRKDGKCGYIDKNGTEAIPCRYDFGWGFSNGLARIEKDGKYGFINTMGTEVIPCQYDYAWDFSEGFAPVMIGERFENGKWGIINTNGIVVVPFLYDDIIFEFSEGLVPVEQDGKWGYVDSKGTSKIPFIYSYAQSFSEGLAYVENEYGKGGYINKDGTVIIPFKWSHGYPFSEGLARVKDSFRYVVIDKEGNTIP